ncbi:MAG: glycosyltransferase family 4 protein [Pseudomonadota bacterium]
MHIAHVSHAREFRGGDRQMLLLIDALRDRGLHQSALVRSPETAKRLRRLGHVAVREARSPLSALRALRGVDLCHAHCGRAVQTATLAKLRYGAASVVTRRIARAPKRGPITRWMYRRTDGLAAVSTAVAGLLRDYDSALRPRVILDGVSVDALIAEARPAFNARSALPPHARDRFLVGHIAALDDADKGQRMIFDIAARLLLSKPEIHFVLIGEGSDREAFERETVCLPNVSLVGWQDDIAAWYQALDIVVAPSRREGLGSAIIEAMGFGLPVVATRTGGIPQIIADRRHGLLVDVDDTQALQDGVERLQADAALRARLGDAARQRAGKYTVDQMTADYLALYAAADKRFEPWATHLPRASAPNQKRHKIPAAGKTPSQLSSEMSRNGTSSSLRSTS